MSKSNVTRGYGLLEAFLAQKRCALANKIIAAHQKSGRVLDIGCGSYPLFLLRSDFHEKYGLDKVSRQNQENELQNSGIVIIDHDLEKEDALPFSNDYFDVVTMLAVFEHIEPERLTQLLSEIHRILKPGGLYIMTTPASWADGLLKMMARLRLVSPVEIEEHKDTYTHSKISSLLQKASFQKDKLFYGYFEMFMNLWAMAIK